MPAKAWAGPSATCAPSPCPPTPGPYGSEPANSPSTSMTPARKDLGPLAAEITQMCSAAEEQPDGLLWLGSWDPEAVPTESETQP